MSVLTGLVTRVFTDNGPIDQPRNSEGDYGKKITFDEENKKVRDLNDNGYTKVYGVGKVISVMLVKNFWNGKPFARTNLDNLESTKGMKFKSDGANALLILLNSTTVEATIEQLKLK